MQAIYAILTVFGFIGCMLVGCVMMEYFMRALTRIHRWLP